MHFPLSNNKSQLNFGLIDVALGASILIKYLEVNMEYLTVTHYCVYLKGVVFKGFGITFTSQHSKTVRILKEGLGLPDSSKQCSTVQREHYIFSSNTLSLARGRCH